MAGSKESEGTTYTGRPDTGTSIQICEKHSTIQDSRSFEGNKMCASVFLDIAQGPVQIKIKTSRSLIL